MRIIQINSWYGVWSTGKLVKILHEGFKKLGHESFVLYGRGRIVSEKNVFKIASTIEPKINSILSRFTGMLYGGCFFSTNRIIREIKKIKPDIVHIHCANSFIANNYKLLKFLGKNNYKVVITLHAEYPYTGSCAQSIDCNQWIDGCNKCPNKKMASRSIFFDNTRRAWLRMNQSFNYILKENRKIVAVSVWLMERAKKSKTFKDDVITVIFNGIDNNIYHKKNVKCLNFLNGIDNKKKCLFCVPNFSINKNDIKGCKDFLTIAKRMQNDDNFVFLVVGDNRGSFDFSNYSNIKYLGPVFDNEVMANIYSFSDMTLLLSKRETYSLVTAESISCGTPVIGYKSGAPETIALSNFGSFYDNGDIDGIIKEIKTRSIKKPKYTNLNKTYYSSSRMVSEYIDIYNSLMNKD